MALVCVEPLLEPRARGAQYKVLSTIYNILGRVSLIRHARQGHDSPTTTTADGDDHVISRATALHTAAEAPHAPHTHARSFASTHGSRPLPSTLPNAISQTVHSKLDQMAPGAARRRQQRVEVHSTPRRSATKAQRVQDEAYGSYAQRRSDGLDAAAHSARPAVNHLPHACERGAERHKRVMRSVRAGWHGEVRSVGSGYRARTILRVESARAAR